MNPLDITISVVLGFCLIRGFFRGLVKELASIVGVLAGFFAANLYYPLLSEFLARWISQTAYLNILSFLLIFCSVFIVISVLGIIIRYLMNITSLGWFDRLFGVGFGVVKGLLIVSVVLLALTTFLPKQSPVIKDSALAPYVMVVADKMGKVVSREMRDTFDEKMQALKKAWESI
jgi:membrane protein required for colicin V production